MSKERLIPILPVSFVKESLKDIYDFYKEKSPGRALNVKNDLVRSPKTIGFAKQNQEDDINPKYRRIVVRDFKGL